MDTQLGVDQSLEASSTMILNCKAAPVVVKRVPCLSGRKLTSFGVQWTRPRCTWGRCKEGRHWVKASADDGEDFVSSNRNVQVKGSQLLMKLLEADDLRQAAIELVPEMDESFFMVGSTYMDMAKKDKQTEVAARIEAALKVAMEEKGKTLRPEIRLLNELIAVDDSVKRKRILNTKSAGEALQMNEGYFFILLSQFRSDVEKQPDKPGKNDLLDQLQEIEMEALSRASGMKGFG